MKSRLIASLFLSALCSHSFFAAVTPGGNPGDMATLRAVNNAGEVLSPGANASTDGPDMIHDWDVSTFDATYDPSGATDIAVSSGLHLVLYQSQFSGDDRAEVQSKLNLAGSDLAAGWSQGFVRGSSSVPKAITTGGALIRATNDDEVLRLISFRSDSETSTVNRVNGESTLQLLKLSDGWNFLSIERSSNGGAVSNSYSDVTWDTITTNQGTAFTYSAGTSDVTINETGLYLVFANTGVERTNQSSSTRLNIQQQLTLDSNPVDGTLTTSYIRGHISNAGAHSGVASIGTLVDVTSSGQVLNVEVRGEISEAATITGGRTALTIVKLPNNAERISLFDNSGQEINDVGPVTFNTENQVDTAFSYNTANGQTTVNQAGDFLFFTHLFADQAGASTSALRVVANQGLQVNGTGGLQPQGQGAGYMRDATGAETVGSWGGGLLELNYSNTVEMVTQPLGGADNLASDAIALQGLYLGNLFSVVTVNDESGISDEDTVATETVTGNLLANDSSTLGGLFVSDFSSLSSEGASVVVNSDGTFTYDPTQSIPLQALRPGESVVDTFTYEVSDAGGATATGMVSLTINGVDDVISVLANPDFLPQVEKGEIGSTTNSLVGNESFDIEQGGVGALLVNFDLLVPHPSNRWRSSVNLGNVIDWQLDGVTQESVTSSHSGIAQAYYWDGSASAYLRYSDDDTELSFNELTPNKTEEDVTWEFWVRPDASFASSIRTLFETGGGTGFGIVFDNGVLKAATGFDGATVTESTVTYDLIADPLDAITGAPGVSAVTADFQQFIITLGVETKRVTLYINGIEVDASTTGIDDDWSGDDAAGLGRFGEDNHGGFTNNASGTIYDTYFEGYLAIVRLYDGLLSPLQIAQTYSAIATETDIEGDPITREVTGIWDQTSESFVGINQWADFNDGTRIRLLDTEGRLEYDFSSPHFDVLPMRSELFSVLYQLNGDSVSTAQFHVTGKNILDTQPILAREDRIRIIDANEIVGGFILDEVPYVLDLNPNTYNRDDLLFTFQNTVPENAPPFLVGERVEGASSGAVGRIFLIHSHRDPGRLYVERLSGTFQEGETITGFISGETIHVIAIEEQIMPAFDLEIPFSPQATPPAPLDIILDEDPVIVASRGGVVSNYGSIGRAFVNPRARFSHMNTPQTSPFTAYFDLLFKPDGIVDGEQLLVEFGDHQLGFAITYDTVNQTLIVRYDLSDGNTNTVSESISIDEFTHVGLSVSDSFFFLSVNGDPMVTGLNYALYTDGIEVFQTAPSDTGGIGIPNGTMIDNLQNTVNPFTGEIARLRAATDAAFTSPEWNIEHSKLARRMVSLNAVDQGAFGTEGPAVTTTLGATIKRLADGSLEYDATTAAFPEMLPGEVLVDTFDYTADDGSGGLISGTASIEVQGIGSVVAEDDFDVGVAAGSSHLIDVAANDTGVTPPAQLSIVSQNVLGNLTIENSQVRFDPAGQYDYLNAGELAFGEFRYALIDPVEGTTEATVFLTITGDFKPPVAVDDDRPDFATHEDQTTIAFEFGSVLDNDFDLDAGETSQLVVAQVQGVASPVGTTDLGARVVVMGDGFFGYDTEGVFDYLSIGDPDAIDTFRYRTIDPNGLLSNEATVTFRVTPRNDGLTATDKTYVVDPDKPFVGNLLTDDTGEGLHNSIDLNDVLSIGTLDDTTAQGTLTYDSASTPPERDVAEFGLATVTPGITETVPFTAGKFIDPVVIVSPAHSSSIDASFIPRVSQVDGFAGTFELDIIIEPGYPPGTYSAAVSWAVFESGQFKLPNGTQLEVGKVTTAAIRQEGGPSSWENVTFSKTFSSAPVVVATAQTFDASAPGASELFGLRMRNLTTSSFDVAMEDHEGDTINRGSAVETIGWVALEPQVGSWSSSTVEAGITSAIFDSEQVTPGIYDNQTGLPLTTISSPLVLLANLATYNDSDPVNITRDIFQQSLFVVEDQVNDTELEHNNEAASFIAFDTFEPVRATPDRLEFDGTFSYTADTAGLGTSIVNDSFTFSVYDPYGEFDTAVANITIKGDTPIRLWRDANIGNANNTGNAADLFDIETDGLVNVVEFAFGLNPTQSDPGAILYDGGSVTRGVPTINIVGGEKRIRFMRRKDHGTLGSVTYAVEFSGELEQWEVITTLPSVLADDGNYELVEVTFPALLTNGKTPRFARVVTER